MKLRLTLAAATILLTLPLQAQTGCVTSPENPTAVLALVGAAGAGLSALRQRLRRK